MDQDQGIVYGPAKRKKLSINIFKDLNFPDNDENIMDKIDSAQFIIGSSKRQLERIKNNTERQMRKLSEVGFIKPSYNKSRYPTSSIRKFTSIISKSKNSVSIMKQKELVSKKNTQIVKNQTTNLSKNVAFSEDLYNPASSDLNQIYKEINSSMSNDQAPYIPNIFSLGSPREADEYLLLKHGPSTRNNLSNFRLNSTLSIKKDKIQIKNFLGNTSKRDKAKQNKTKGIIELDQDRLHTNLKYHPTHKTLYNIKKASIIPVNKRILNACNLLSFVNITLNNELHNGIKKLTIPHIPKNAKDERRIDESDMYQSIPITINHKNSEQYLTYRHISTANKAERNQMRLTFANDETAKLIRIGDMANKLSEIDPSTVKPLQTMYITENKKLNLDGYPIRGELLKLNTHNVYRNNFEISKKKHMIDLKRLRLFTKIH